MSLPRIESSESLTVFVDNKSHTVRKSDAKYAEFARAVEAEDMLAIRLALGIGAILPVYTKGQLSIVDGEVVYNGQPMHNVVTQKIIALLKAGKKYQYMLNFLERVKANPSQTAVEELYLFLEKAQIPITPEGHFLAYRKVDDNYMSFHANPDGTKNRNQVGDVVTMDREVVDTNRHNTCSRGLHFCSFSYLSQYHGGTGRVMIVSIDPADVVSIPSDYSNSKGRCCKYTVVAEHNAKEKQEAFKDVVLANPDGTAHEGKDIELQEIATAKQATPKNKSHRRILQYVRTKLERGVEPTIRQIQSCLSPATPTVASLEKTLAKLGLVVKPAKSGVRSAATVSEK